MNGDGHTQAGGNRTPFAKGGPTDAEARMRRDRTVRLVSALVVLVSLGACVALAVLQIVQRDDVAEYRHAGVVAGDEDVLDSDASDVDERDSLVDLLPARIGGFRTAARHEVPGFERQMAEAIYTPTDEEVSVRTPLNCYVVVRAVQRERIEEEFDRLAAEHPDRIAAPDLGIGSDALFAARDRSTYVIVWRKAGHLVLVDTRFTVAVPVEQGDLLELHGAVVAEAVAEEMGR